VSVSQLRCVERVKLALEPARGVHVPPVHSEEDRDARGDNRDDLDPGPSDPRVPLQIRQTGRRSGPVDRAKTLVRSTGRPCAKASEASFIPMSNSLNRMRRNARPSSLLLACGLVFSTGVVRLSGQAPPPREMRPWVVMDVGPIPAPSVCDCVTRPFTVTRPRPGFGYASGLAAPDADAPLTLSTGRFQAQRDAEDRASLPTSIENGLGGNGNESIGIAWLISGGTAVERNHEQATAWFLLAAGQGHPNAFAALGHRYLRGLGIEQNDSAAADWFSRGAASGDRAAMSALGGLHALGRGVPEDWATAVAWWTKAENWRFVGDAYACGLGGEQNGELAAAAYQRGVENADMMSSVQLGHIYESRCAAPPSADAAYEAYRRAADEGYPEAQVALSKMYLDGRGVIVSPYQAYFWARLAELRLPAGELQSLARSRAALAARFLPAFEITQADTLVKSAIATGSEPMNK
jgi:TPR repeat protein